MLLTVGAKKSEVNMWSAVFDIPPTKINGSIFVKVAVSDRVIEHNGEITEAIVKYYVSTLNEKQLSPKETDSKGPVFVRSSNCLLGIAVPFMTAFRDSRFRLIPEEQTIFVFHLCPINERYFKKHYPDGPTKY